MYIRQLNDNEEYWKWREKIDKNFYGFGNIKYLLKKKTTEKECRKNLKYNLNSRVSGSMYASLRKNKKCGYWKSVIDYSLSDLIKRLKSTMPEGYNWNDYLNGKLHIDHIIPKRAFNYDNPKHTDFKRCWALDNLQLLPAKENMTKNGKLTKPFQPALLIKL